MENLEKLRELTENLPAVPKLLNLIHHPGKSREYTEYKVEGGTCIGLGLLSQNEVGVQKVFMSKGSTFPTHDHLSTEIIIVFQGELEIKCKEKSTILGVGDIIKFNKQEEHCATAVTDTWAIAVSIPRDNGYPK